MTSRSVRNLRGFFSDYYFGSVLASAKGRGRKKLTNRETDAAYLRFVRVHERAEGRAAGASECRERFLRPLFRDVLGLHLGAGEDGIHALHVDAEAEASGAAPLLLALCGAWDEDLLAGRGASSPRGRLEEALARAQLRYGLLASGERLLLVRAPGEGPRGSALEIDLAALAEDDDSDGFALALSLVGAASFLPDVEGEEGVAPIDRIERESREQASKVSADLKQAVFRATESLVRGLIEDAVVRGSVADPAELSEAELARFRDASLICIYRLLFILYAEDRDPRLEEHRLYLESYSAHGLLDEIFLDPTRDWPENRSALWARVQALFRIYDEGLPAIAPYEHIPPRGSDFFSRETPEGRALEEARLSDRAVAALMLDLATTAPRPGVGRERISFRELDIENLGAVYEGLLEHEPRVAPTVTLELRVQGKPYALAMPDVIRLCTEKDLRLRGDAAMVAGTAVEYLHPDFDDGDEDEDKETDEADAEEEEDDDAGVKKGGTARLIRRLEPGAFHFVPGGSRKGSGSFYTPLPLVQDVVRHALGPAVRGRSAAEIERLRVLDPACGSAHFLVEAMRYLARELHRAYVDEHGADGPPAFEAKGTGWDVNWRASDADARAANSEARAWCKRRIAERCLFGVDRNPTAVQLGRVALWIESLAGDRPLSYFQHHVRCGNSLLGTWLDRLDRAPLPELATKAEGKGAGLFEQVVRNAVADAARARRLIDRADPDALRGEGVEPETVAEIDFKERQRAGAERTLAAARLLFDLRSASAFVPAIWKEWEVLCSLVGEHDALSEHALSRPWWDAFERVRAEERFFHWELEFPEVFLDPERSGFDAVLGNPPWDKVLPTKHEFYGQRDVLIRAFKGNELDRRIRELHSAEPELAERFKGYRERTRTRAQILRKGGDFPLSRARSGAAHEDVSKYFVDRAARLAADGGAVGMIVPSVLYNGDGCVGIRRFLLEEASIERFYGFENRKRTFPIHASYKFVSLVFRKGTPADGFDAAFMRTDLTEFESNEDRPWVVRVSAEEIRRLSPETLALLEYRSEVDQRILHRMHLMRDTVGSRHDKSWKVRLVSWRRHESVFNSAADKDLFTNPARGRLHRPEDVLRILPRDPEDLIEAMREAGFYPVFEGKHIDQYLVGIKPIRWWLSVEQAKEKYDKTPREGATLVFRETARNTDERTCIAAVLPPRSAAAHTLTGMRCKNVEIDAAATVLNSFCFDYALRLRTAGTHVSFTYILPMPVPPADVVNALPRIPTLSAWAEGIEHVTDREDLWPALWDANRAVAEAYGLGHDDLAHVLSTFPVMARKRPEFFAYLQQRLFEWSAEPTALPAAASHAAEHPPAGPYASGSP